MLDYVVQVTKDATGVGKVDIEGLRAAGFDDRGILQITLIASWFNYINRVADALGVGREYTDRGLKPESLGRLDAALKGRSSTCRDERLRN